MDFDSFTRNVFTTWRRSRDYIFLQCRLTKRLLYSPWLRLTHRQSLVQRYFAPGLLRSRRLRLTHALNQGHLAPLHSNQEHSTCFPRLPRVRASGPPPTGAPPRLYRHILPRGYQRHFARLLRYELRFEFWLHPQCCPLRQFQPPVAQQCPTYLHCEHSPPRCRLQVRWGLRCLKTSNRGS